MRSRSTAPAPAKPKARVSIAVPILPHVANFDDLDPLDAEPAVDLVRVRPGHALPGDADLVILPGSKATIADLAVLRQAGFDIDIARAPAARRQRAGAVRRISDAGTHHSAIRSASRGPPAPPRASDCSMSRPMLSSDKRLEPVCGTTCDGVPFSGYEMHMGVTAGPDRVRPFARLADGSPEGAVSADGRVIGTYIHGLFADDRQRAAWLKRFAAGRDGDLPTMIWSTKRSIGWPTHLATHIDLDRLIDLSR